jgi:hypothetical protein
MKRNGAVCTIIAKNYLAHARCLMDSLAQFHPELARFVILADTVDGHFEPARENFQVLTSAELGIPDSRWFHFKYVCLELCTALKPYVLEHLLAAHDLDYVLYLDPDVLICGDLTPLLERLETDSLVLTPHVTEPLKDGAQPSEVDILRAGTYNLGFIAVRKCDEALAFVRWWKQRLHEYCVIDLPRGLFLDQRWVDLAPSLVSRVCVLRDPAYNVAYWNLSQREISFSGGQFLVNGRPLAFYHFSGFDPDRIESVTKHQAGFSLSEHPALVRLAEEYRGLLLAQGYAECRNWPNAYNSFNNGIPIPDAGRTLNLENPSSAAAVADPFSDRGFREFVRVWNEPIAVDGGAQPYLTRLAYKIYRTQSDLQAAMPDVFNGGHREFLEWLLSDRGGPALPDVFLAPLRKARTSGEDRPQPTPAPGTPLALALAAGKARLPLPRLALDIYAKRPDLQAFFPDCCGRDSVKYLVWLLSFGRREYLKSPAFSLTLRRLWTEVVRSLPSLWQRTRYRCLLGFAQMAATTGPLFSRAVRSRLCRRILGGSTAPAPGSKVPDPPAAVLRTPEV